MGFINDEKRLGFVPLGANKAIGVTIGVGTIPVTKGKPVVDIRMFYRDMDGVDMAVYDKEQKSGYPVTGLKPSKSGLHLDDNAFKELMRDFLLPHYNTLVKKTE